MPSVGNAANATAREVSQPVARKIALPVMLAVLVAGAAGFIGYVFWPRWPEPPIAASDPPLPIVVAGVPFNVPPAAMRMPVQRHPGAHERVDLAFLWPSLLPPDPT